MIVLVEDSSLNQRIFKHFLGQITPERLVVFGDGRESIAYIKENSSEISMIVLDGNLNNALPDGSRVHGPDVAREISETCSSIPIASWTDDTVMLARFQQEFSNYSYVAILNKPLKLAELEDLYNEFAQNTFFVCAPN